MILIYSGAIIYAFKMGLEGKSYHLICDIYSETVL